MRAVPFVAVALAAGALAGGLNAARPSQPPSRLPDAVAPAAAAERPYGADLAELEGRFAPRPATSCSAASCHGGGAVGRVGSEHSTWARTADPSETAGDPHAKAYSVLFNKVSVRMGQLLGYDGSTKEKALPHNNANCLACHSTADAARDADTREQYLAEGVGCIGCHGPAEKWIAEHTLPSWKGRSNESKWKEFGFVPTKNLVARTLSCASCHVGGGNRDMNHDMIAAGHPRLAFEPASFHASGNYRKHWAEKATTRDFEVRVWAVGKVATLRAAVNLLHERAVRTQQTAAKAPGHRDTPWPEFSGYSCFACHQGIGDPKLRGELSASTRPVGLPGWEVWSNTGADVALKACGMTFPGLSSSNPDMPKLKELKELMDGKREPDAAKVAGLAAAARGELDRLLAQLQAAEERGPGGVPEGTPREILRLLAGKAIAGDRLADHDWDALATSYLGAASMYAATGGNSGREVAWAGSLANLRTELRYPGGHNGPAKFGQPNLSKVYDGFKGLLPTKTSQPEGK